MPEMLRVLLVEDCAADAELVVRSLRRSGLGVEWGQAQSAAELGALLDPIADKLLLTSAVILLGGPEREGHLPRFPLWYTGTVLGRDLVIVIGVAVLHYLSIRVRVRPVWYGKVATACQMACVCWALLKWPLAPLGWLLGVTAILTGSAGVRYLMDGIQQAGSSPTSNPQKP